MCFCNIGDKSVGVNQPKQEAASHHIHHEVPSKQAVPASGNPLKALSPNCAVRVAGEGEIAGWMRLRLSKEEIEVINNGGYETPVIGDWKKVKLM